MAGGVEAKRFRPEHLARYQGIIESDLVPSAIGQMLLQQIRPIAP